jgi:Lipocalin-like domain
MPEGARNTKEIEMISVKHSASANKMAKVSAAALLFAALAASPGMAAGLTDQLVGTWMVVSNVETWDDGKKVEWGPDIKGTLMIDASGHYSFQMGVGDRPKSKGNPADDPKGKYIGYIGNYEVNDGDKLLSLSVERSTSPNLEGGVQKRKILSLSETELVYSAADPIKAGDHTFVPTLTFKKAK